MILTLDNVIQCDTMCMFCCHVLSAQNSCHIQLDNKHIMGWSKKAMSAKRIFNSFQHGEILRESVLGFQQQWAKDVDRSLHVVVKTCGKMERKMTNLSVNPFTIGAIPSHHWSPLRYAWG